VTISGNVLTGTVPVGAGAIGGGGGATIVIERSVVRDNSSTAASSSEGAGAIASDGSSVTISDSAVEDNLFAGTNSSAAAGAVSIANAPGGALVVARSSISRNSVDPVAGTNSSAVGGLEVNLGGSMTVTDSTVSRNTVSFDGASGFRTGGIDTSSVPSTTLTNVTMTDNFAATGTGFLAHSISWFGGATTRIVRNSILGGYAPHCFITGPPITSSGGNLEDANTCGFNGPGDLVNTDADLGPLRNNGGLGRTQLPLPSSPVFGLARPAFCSVTDQRGVARPQGGACDSGAAESATPPVNTTPPSVSGTAASGQTLTCDPGTFTQAPTLALQWLSDGAAISGATGSTFTVTDAQLDTAVQCRVTATNVGGTTAATSAAVVPPRPAAVALPPPPSPPAPPANTVRPSFDGTLRTGQQLTCSSGTFTDASSFTFAWLRNGTPIAGATDATYTLTATDAGRALQCRVTAAGPGGSAVAESAPAVPGKACIVPTLVGQPLATARRRLTSANCAVGKTTKKKSKKKPGVVLASSRAKGTNLPAGTKVALTIAKK
jgi:hypothetical protein